MGFPLRVCRHLFVFFPNPSLILVYNNNSCTSPKACGVFTNFMYSEQRQKKKIQISTTTLTWLLFGLEDLRREGEERSVVYFSESDVALGWKGGAYVFWMVFSRLKICVSAKEVVSALSVHV